MKQFMILMVIVTCVACHRSMPPWPYEGDKQDITLQIRTDELTGFRALPQTCQLFLYDAAQNTTARYSATREGSNNRYQLKIFPGNYTGYCVTDADADSYWDYKPENAPDKIYLKTQTKGGCGDHLIGSNSLKISAEGGNTFTFDMERKVAQLLVVIENYPDWLTDLNIELKNVPSNISLTGVGATKTGTITCNANLPEKEKSVTSILIFPPTTDKKITMTLSSDELAYVSEVHTINEIVANKITQVNIVFKDLPDMSAIDFTTSVVEWDKDTIRENDWEITPPLPPSPCTGTGDGNNLVNNPGFEDEYTDQLPAGWKLDAGGASKKVSRTTASVHAGTYAARLDGKTYLYQDIAISGGQCYQLKMFVNAPGAETKWRYWCTWFKDSKTNLPSDEIRTNTYQNQTEGYIDVFNGGIFRAPATATKLRMEIRTYTNTDDESAGLYVDDVSVEAVN